MVGWMKIQGSLVRTPSSSKLVEQDNDSALEGVAANVKLLLKLVQDHKEACQKNTNDGRRMLRVAGMMTILDMVRTRIQKCQSFGVQRTSLRRCNSDIRACVEKDKAPTDSMLDDQKEMLKRELNASMTARKTLEKMCSSLGKEKEIMMGELARKAHELAEMEDHINDLKTQNGTLLEKVKECAQVYDQHGPKETQGNATLDDRNKTLSDQLMRSLNGYRTMKNKLTEAHEENVLIQSTMEEMGIKVRAIVEKIRKYRQTHVEHSEELADIEEGILELEHMSKCVDVGDKKHGVKQGQPNNKMDQRP
nr:DNA double-strand break repair Rad50 ATPase [Tanacetum cinerariifolium]